MENLFIYLLKSSAVLLLFYLVYIGLLQTGTYFKANRWFLITGLVLAFVFPFIPWRQTVLLQTTALPSPIGNSPLGLDETTGGSLGLFEVLLGVYFIGLIISLGRLGRDLWSVYQLINKPSSHHKQGKYTFVETQGIRSPFSFFNYIFYAPDKHSQTELEMVLNHEKAHSREKHSLDILLMRFCGALLWFNPGCLFYEKSLRQNLEYLADAQAIQDSPCKKEYQYTLLRLSGNTPAMALVNPIYNSLIKKRIVMMHKSKPKSIQMLRHLAIVPLLALFLVAFNKETVYQVANEQMVFEEANRTIEVIIDKTTTDAELAELKSDMKTKDVDFSYTVVRNNSGEIINISFDIKGKSKDGSPFSGSYNPSSESPIEPIVIRITDGGGLSFGTVSSMEGMHSGGHETFVIHTEDAEGGSLKHRYKIHAGSSSGADEVFIWNSNGEDDKVVEVKVEEINGEKTITVNGEEVSEAEYEAMKDKEGNHKIHVQKIKKNMGENVFIVKESDVDEDIEVVSGGGSFYFVDSGKGEKPLYYIDGKKATKAQMEKLDSDNIATMNVRKGDAAIKKYGKKAKNGVIEITTKE